MIHGFIGLKIKWVMKKELGEIPVFGPACHQLGCIFVDRANPGTAIKSLETAKGKLSKKSSVLFFSEGTRSRDGKVMPFKKGAFIFAMENKLPILPITVKNSFKVLPPDSFDLTPGSVEIIAHRPIYVAAHEMDRLDEIMENTRQTISSAL